MKLLGALFDLEVAIASWLVTQVVSRSFCCGSTGWLSLFKFGISVTVVAALVIATGDAATAFLLWPLAFLLAGFLPFGGRPHLPRGWAEGRDDGIDEWLVATPWRRKWLASDYLKAQHRDGFVSPKPDVVRDPELPSAH